MRNYLKSLAESVGHLFFPHYCISCGRDLVSHENYLCLNCLKDLPYTHFEDDQESALAQVFWGRTHVEDATALLYFNKGSNVQNILHNLKYNGIKQAGVELGALMGERMQRSSNFDKLDMVVPVPLHPLKENERGYNQSAYLAFGVSEALDIPTDLRALQRVEYASTQTKKSRIDRWDNVKSAFRVSRPENVFKKHVLLVDDVITTGATTEACITQLKKIPHVKVSVCSLAFAEV